MRKPIDSCHRQRVELLTTGGVHTHTFTVLQVTTSVGAALASTQSDINTAVCVSFFML
jgi:hypothetical protein